ncbi:MAG: type II/IV secretion system ATPase subunit [bacterium]|nr:type II/IV secretion system ATPase subunit [bacterium]
MQLKYYLVRSGDQTVLKIDVSKTQLSDDIAAEPQLMYNVIHLLKENPGVAKIVVTGVFERVYNEEVTELLKEIANVVDLLEKYRVWTYNYIFGETQGCYSLYGECHDFLVYLVEELLPRDPIYAYQELLQEIERVKYFLSSSNPYYPQECLTKYLKVLEYVRSLLESTKLINYVISQGIRIEKGDRSIYAVLLRSEIKPQYIEVEVVKEPEEKLELVDSYSFDDYEVKIYRHEDKIEYLYYITLPEHQFSVEEYIVYTELMRLVSRGRLVTASFVDPSRTREHLERVYLGMALDVAQQKGIELSPEQAYKIAKVIVRYTVGYGPVEAILRDPKITDVYIDAPVSWQPVYVVHAEYGECVTNIKLTESFLNRLASRLRALSGRPFDEAHPVLDAEIPEPFTRVAAITKPLSPDGIAFALRKHREKPWTYPLFINNRMICPEAAALLSLVIEYNAAIMFTGSRGAGKTSMLGASMLQILPKYRILTIEDTLELPVEYMKKIGFKVQRLKTRSAVAREGEETYELSAADAVRTALRLGDSVLIIGEVRSLEARELFEAMRVGTAGYSVMGTIHGENAYSVWDRIVNDLGIPSTQFKATDLIVVARPLRFKGSLKKYRRVVAITEVKKQWKSDPLEEGGFFDIMYYDIYQDRLRFADDFLEKSELLKKIMKYTGFTEDDILNELAVRSKLFEYIVQVANTYGLPELMEGYWSVYAKNKYILLAERMREEIGGVDYKRLFYEWKSWFDNEVVKSLLRT